MILSTVLELGLKDSWTYYDTVYSVRARTEEQLDVL